MYVFPNSTTFELTKLTENNSDKWKTIPNGGFPNLFKLNMSDKIENVTLSSKREYGQKAPNIINVRDILLKQRHLLNPFIPDNIDE